MATSLTPEQRSLRARIGAHALHAKHDPTVTTAPGRAAFMTRFERQVDPEGKFSEAERQRRAEHAKKAYFTKLALASALARSARNGEGGPKAARTSNTTAVATASSAAKGGRRASSE